MGRMERQQGPHTGPRVGLSSAASHATQRGANTTERTPSASERTKSDSRARAGLSARRRGLAHLNALGAAPQPLERVELASHGAEHMDDEVEVVE